MTGYCVIKFHDESAARITPTELVKTKDSKKFVPVSARDLTDDPIKVKWQKSMSGSFTSDGYYSADLLAIAGSVKTAMAKASELGIKLAPNPVLALPSAPASTGRKNRQKENNDEAAMERTPANDPTSTSAAKESAASKTSKSKQGSNSASKQKAMEKSNDGKVKDGAKLKKLNLDPAAVERSKAQLDLCLKENPVLSGNSSKSSISSKKPDALEPGEDNEACDSANEDDIHCVEFDKSVFNNTNNAAGENVQECSDSKETLPGANLSDKMQDIPGLSSSSSSSADLDKSDSESDSDSEDSTSKLAAYINELRQEIFKLKTELEKAKTELGDSKRNAVLANNLRVAHKEELVNLKKEMASKEERINLLEKRNAMLQDLLCKEKTAGPNKGEVKEKTSTPTADLSHGTIKDEDGNKSIDVSTDFENESFNGATVSASTPKTKRRSDDSESATGKIKKKKAKGYDLDNDEITTVCDNMLKHLKNEVPLEMDEHGFVNLGFDVRVDKKALDHVLLVHKGDVSKIGKNLATLIWTSKQRLERSLEGGVTNRFPHAPPKKAATPIKVHACLGVLKAHLLHEGDSDGPGMKQNLKMGRKAIGLKFAQDINLAKKRGDI